MGSLILIALALLPSVGFSQRLLFFGVKGGVPVTDASSGSVSKNYVIGAMVELKLPLGFGIEADALYKPLNLTVAAYGFGPYSVARAFGDIGSAEFPILAKYHFLHTPLVKPYAEA